MKHDTAPDWPAILHRFKQSSLSQRQFARKEGVSLATFRYRLYGPRSKRRRSSQDHPAPAKAATAKHEAAPCAAPSQEPPGFVTLALSQQPTARESGSLALELGERLKLRFERVPEPAVLADLVSALLSRCPC